MLQGGLSGKERVLPDDEIIVSKTDTKGRIIYCNDVFIRFSGYSERELLGQPHNIVRHPAMPRCVFQLLWSTIASGHEMFAYVVNRAKNGDHYWVLAHVTADVDPAGAVVGYHSFRRSVRRDALAGVERLYAGLCEEERRHGDRKAAMAASAARLAAVIEEKGITYGQYVLGL